MKKIVLFRYIAFSIICLTLYTHKVNAQFANGADVSWVTQMEASGVKFYNNGTQADLFDILNTKCINAIRLRVWVNPAGGWCNKSDVLAKAIRAKNKGYRILIDFHYSDTWADPGNQKYPADWLKDTSLTALIADVAAHTTDVLNLLKTNGITPEWVQVGNETNNGMLWNQGRASTHMNNFALLINSGYNAVKAVFPTAKVIVHISNGYDNTLFRWMFDGLKANGAQWDIIGMSLYPSTTNWATLNKQCLTNMNDMVSRYGKQVMIVEAGMSVSAAAVCDSFLVDIIKKTQSVAGGNGLGVFYWEPECYNNWQGYTMGAFDTNGKPTIAMNAFSTGCQPSVYITTPANNTSVCMGTSITLTASSNGTVNKVSFYDGTTLLSTVNASPYSYVWTNAGTGTHSITAVATDNVNTSSTSSVVSITVGASAVAPVVTTPVTYCQNATATILTATGTLLKWYADNTTTTPLTNIPTPVTTATGTTTYYVSQTTTGCEGPRAKIVVTVNAAPIATITAGSATAFCTGGSVILTSSAGSSYVWKNGATQVGTSAAYSATTAGSYTVEVTNANNCKAVSAATVVTVNTLPAATITAGSATVFCTGGSVILTSSAGSSYIWKNGTTQVGTFATYSATTAGSYTVEVTNANNCKATSAATVVTVNTPPASTISAGSATAFCTGGSVTLTSSAGSSYIWKNGTTQVGTSATYAATTTGSYTVEVTNANNCKAVSAATVITVNTPPIATITAGSATAFCTGGSVTLTSSAGSSYVWKNGTTQVGTSAAYSATTAGSYTVEVTNANNCKAASAATVVTVRVLPSAPIVISTVSYCENVTASQLTATGTVLKWYDAATGGTALANTPTPATTATGTTNYYVSQSTNGCESPRAQIAVTVNALPIATITAGSTTIPSGGSVTLNANTGSGLTYKWFNGSTQAGTGASYVTNAVGSYVVEVTNATGCKATSAVVDVSSSVNRPSVISITSPTADATIVGAITITATVSDPDGNIALVEYLDGNTVIGTSTSQPYSFDWINPGTGNHMITIRVTDSNGGITTSAPVTVTSSTTSTGVNYSAAILASVYPNPSNGDVYVETDMDFSNASFTVINVLGEAAVLSASVNASGARLDVSGLTEGAYILVITEGTSIVRKKITVMR